MKQTQENKLINQAENIPIKPLTGSKSYGQLQRNKTAKQIGIKTSFTGKKRNEA